MKEQLKIIVDDKGLVHVWINGEEQRYITKVKLDIENDNINYPHLVIEKENVSTNIDTERLEVRKTTIIM